MALRISKPHLKAAPAPSCLVILGLCASLVLAHDTCAQSPEDLTARVEHLVPDLVDATVGIFAGAGAGSGVIVTSDGLILTAAHVVQAPGTQLKVLLTDGREVDAVALGTNHDTDAALVQISEPGPFPFRPYADEMNYEVGDTVIATGHPGGPYVGRRPPVRLGTITAAGTSGGFSDPIRSTATVISGDSGGPLFDMAGDVIGIHSNISGGWANNHHVPLPSFIADWDILMASENVGEMQAGGPGGPGGQEDEQRQMIDDPYAALTHEFIQSLEKHRDDPVAAALLLRPAPVAPHLASATLRRLRGEPLGDTASPKFGWTFDLTRRSKAWVRHVEPGGPADRAGIKAGDCITGFNGSPIDTLAELLVRIELPVPLDERGSFRLTLDDRSAQVAIDPDWEHPRSFHPPTVASMVHMQVTEGGEEGGSDDGPFSRFGSALEARSQPEAVVEVLRAGAVIALGTVVSEDGEILTKASELGDAADLDDLKVRVGGAEFAVERVSIDDDTDLARLATEAQGLVPVRWLEEEPAVGALVFARAGERIVTGVMTQAARPCHATGHESSHRLGQSRMWLGVRFDDGSTAPVAMGIESGSPADTAGLLEGDVIQSIDGKDMANSRAVAAEVSGHVPGDKLRVSVLRGDKVLELGAIVDLRPAPITSRFSQRDRARDGQLRSLSASGGALSERAAGFPRCLFHDVILKPSQCGGPLLDASGQAVGINIARAFRHRSLSIPAREALEALDRMRTKD